MKALLCVVMDRSGSMQGKESDVIGGVNRFIEDQRKEPGEAWLTLVRFDTEYEQIYHSVPIAGARLINASDYVPRGGTALLDSVGRAITALDATCTTMKPDKVIVVIVTDGMENSSKEFSKQKIKSLIDAREESGKWVFVYLGADANAFTEASDMGFKFNNTAKYANTKKGTEDAYSVMSASVGSLRSGAQNAGLGGDIGESKYADPWPTLIGGGGDFNGGGASGDWSSSSSSSCSDSSSSSSSDSSSSCGSD